MTSHRLVLASALLLVSAIGAVYLSIELSNFAGVPWISGTMGFATFFALKLIFTPSFRRAIKDGYFPPIKRSDFSWPKRLLQFIAGVGLALFVFWQLGDERPWLMFMAGFWMGWGVWALVEPLPQDAEVLADE